jgi:hypothetical protein
MPPKADTPAPPMQPAETGVSGKWVIIGIFSLAFAAAGGSWWFRFHATHHAAEFFGPQAAALIRDAPTVDFSRLNPPVDSTIIATKSNDPIASDPANIRDVTTAHGLVHLRNALLEDRSYQWPPQVLPPDTRWEWAMSFKGDTANQRSTLYFSPDCKFVAASSHPNEILSCAPIAAGLAEMFAEFSAAKPADSAAPASIANPAR